MHKILELDSTEDCGSTNADLSPVYSSTLATHRPDCHRVIHSSSGELLAHCSLWWRNRMQCDGRRVGLIGHYGATNLYAARALINNVCHELAAQGCEMAVGPIDGNTWRQYRLVVQRSPHPPFFLEPDHPHDWPQHFTHAGFEPLAYYFSAVNTDLNCPDTRAHAAETRLRQQGVTIRSAERLDLRNELRRIHGIATVAFRNNLLFEAIDEMDFLKECEPLLPLVRPELILLAEQDGQTVGFVVALPNYRQAERGTQIDSVIIKTLGALPNPRFAGIGNVLLAATHLRANELGYRQCIHALVREQSHLQRLSARTARVIRRYALYAKDLFA